MKNIKPSLFIVVILSQNNAIAKTYDFSNGMQFAIEGYLGWKQIITDVEYNAIPSEPEIGITSSMKLTDRLVIFNQFRYGNSIDSILTYNQLSYTPNIPIDDFTLTLKGGKLWYDWGLYGKTRVNPRTRQGVFQPQAIYWNSLDETITGGAGVGFDLKYKNFSISYIIDKSTIGNPDTSAQNWTLEPLVNLTTKFGQHQMVSINYDMSEYGLRGVASWSTFDFNLELPFTHQTVQGGTNQYNLGVEWTHDELMLSAEGLCTEPHAFSGFFCGFSTTAEYDITDNYTVRLNYNEYSSRHGSSQTLEQYTSDVNLGINWHYGSWMANVEGHYVRGGRSIDYYNFQNNPDQYDHFYVVGMNLVYFFE